MNTFHATGNYQVIPMSVFSSSAMVRPASVSVESTTARLVARLQAGETAALAELYDEHALALTCFARRLVGDADPAQDLVQEVFLALPGAIHWIRPRCDGSTSNSSEYLALRPRFKFSQCAVSDSTA